jgi:hypothetical protein
MNPDDITVLLEAVHGGHGLLEQFLGFARNDVERVTEVLGYAQGDRATLERLRDMAKEMKDKDDPGGRYEHEALRPWALAANMRHFLEAHTARYFDLANRQASLTGFWPLVRPHRDPHDRQAPVRPPVTLTGPARNCPARGLGSARLTARPAARATRSHVAHGTNCSAIFVTWPF